MPQTLNDKISGFKEMGGELPLLPEHIITNLNQRFQLRPYQKEAFQRLCHYLASKTIRRRPSQLLFHMATGSGKTLIMAGAILHLYEQGYRNFLFFVNSTNIINKTRDNFLNPASIKYLFNDNININFKAVSIKEADNFQSTNQDDINIVFSTTQKLHMGINLPRENSITLEDFEEKKIVLISDEAHHINVDTKKKLNKEETATKESWETTVNYIFRSNPDNILLEFTATANLEDPQIAMKYADKLLFDYPLKHFRRDRYSKEVQVLQADITDLDRTLQAMLLSQYRRKMFEKHRIFVKPVVLLKSNSISDSTDFFIRYLEMLKSLSAEKIENLKNQYESSKTMQKCFEYFQSNNITNDNLANELRNDFAEEKCLIINSKDDSIEKQIAVNTLEDTNNGYRAIFAVQKLIEGWDVLNLFDIVRLYNTRDAKGGKPGKKTVAEAQLIGRGARYCPFTLHNDGDMYQRKFDEDLENEMRACEELYYHSAYNPRYIQELHEALRETGIMERNVKEISLELKETFKETDFYENGLIFTNDVIKRTSMDLHMLPNTITEKAYSYMLHTGETKKMSIFDTAKSHTISKKQKNIKLNELGIPTIRKAMAKIPFYRFDNLKVFFPTLTSAREFMCGDGYLGKINITIEGREEHLENISQQRKLSIALNVLQDVAEGLKGTKSDYYGDNIFKPRKVKEIFKNKKMNISRPDVSTQERGISQTETNNTELRIDLSKKDWYAFIDNYGTSEEKFLVKYINQVYDKLAKVYSEIYLLRNEKHFKIYNFDDGRAFEPDFVLFLKKKDTGTSLHYQVFIEPKGNNLLEEDKWKESFLKAIKTRHKLIEFISTQKYEIWGMPFFNEANRKAEFTEYLENAIKLDV